jgi:hypothetical protein
VQIFSTNLSKFAESDNPMPFRNGGLFPGSVDPILCGGHPKICHRSAIAQILHLGVRTQITDENDFVHSGHNILLFLA